MNVSIPDNAILASLSTTSGMIYSLSLILKLIWKIGPIFELDDHGKFKIISYWIKLMFIKARLSVQDWLRVIWTDEATFYGVFVVTRSVRGVSRAMPCSQVSMTLACYGVGWGPLVIWNKS